MSEAEQLRREVQLLEQVLAALDDADKTVSLPVAETTESAAVDIAAELKPFFRRLFSSDQLRADDCDVGGASKATVTLEVVGGGDEIASVWCFASTAAKACLRCRRGMPAEEQSWGAGADVYCKACYKCEVCSVALADQVGISVGASLFCKLHSDRCAKCDKPFAAGKVVTALGKRFHTTCFCCTTCARPFRNDESILMADGEPYCSDHAPASEDGDEEGESYTYSSSTGD